MTEPTLRKAGVTVITFVVLAKVFGLARETVVAGTFGTSSVVDTYLAAIIIPAIFCNILYQALPNALIPLFTHDVQSPSARRLSMLLLGASLSVSALVWFTAPWTASLTNSGFSAPLQRDTVNLVQIGSLAILLATVEALARSRLIAQKRFIQSGSSAIWSSICVVGAVIFFPEAGAYALMWGYVIGMLAVAIWNSLPLGRRSISAPSPDSSPASDSMAHGDSWIFVALTVSTIGLLNGLIDRHLGSFLPEGSLAALQYADLIASQPVAILGIALAGAIFPYLASAVQAGDSAAAGSILDRAIRWSLLAVIPLGLVLVFYASPVVRILFERGEFNQVSREMTGPVLSVYGFWMIPSVLAAIIAKVHYSMRRARPLLLGIGVALTVKALLSLWLVSSHGISGLAMASLAGSLTYLVVLAAYLPNWGRQRLWRGWLGLSVALTIFALVGCGCARLIMLIPAYPASKLGPVITLTIALAVTTALVLKFGARVGIPEARRVSDLVISRLKDVFNS